MTIRMSTGLRHAVITNDGVGSVMNGGSIHIFSGPQPPSADSPVSGALLAVIAQGGIGLQLRGGQLGEIVNDGPWVMNCSVSGAPGWWRFTEDATDPGGYSQTTARIDGSVGDSLTDIPPSLDAFTTIPVASFSLRFTS